MELTLRETVLAAILVLLLGRLLNAQLAVLRTYNIPQPVSGGIAASLLTLLAHQFFGFDLQFDTSLRDVLLLAIITLAIWNTILGYVLAYCSSRRKKQ